MMIEPNLYQYKTLTPKKGAWDSYVQGDPMQMWSMNHEGNPADGQQAQQQQQMAQHQAQQQMAQQASGAMSMNNMFMGPSGAANADNMM
jgi:hypothetical protein